MPQPGESATPAAVLDQISHGDPKAVLTHHVKTVEKNHLPTKAEIDEAKKAEGAAQKK
ncbi:hypothetical protein HDU89_008763 [Geranomyces variabilis]|nr:hypothetical protein HDU90_007929 [Geranomyces variabilis]KAJ3153898.1 hypothetical protein HDU89_008763 [Geranomyces variabilis]